MPTPVLLRARLTWQEPRPPSHRPAQSMLSEMWPGYARRQSLGSRMLMLAHCSVSGYSTVGKEGRERSAAVSIASQHRPLPRFPKADPPRHSPRLSKTGTSKKATESQRGGETDGDKEERAEERERKTQRAKR